MVKGRPVWFGLVFKNGQKRIRRRLGMSFKRILAPKAVMVMCNRRPNRLKFSHLWVVVCFCFGVGIGSGSLCGGAGGGSLSSIIS